MQNLTNYLGLTSNQDEDPLEDLSIIRPDLQESAFNYSLSPLEKEEAIKRSLVNQRLNLQTLSNAENGFGAIWNTELMLVNTGNNSKSNRDTCCHFVYVQKVGNEKKFYLYRGMNFYDKDGYELIMMATHEKAGNEIKIYAVNDIEATRE